TVQDKDRHEILSQIIDLSKYQYLHERADGHRKNHKGQADAFQSQVQGISTVNDSDIESLTREATSASAIFEKTRSQLDDLIALKIHARNWNKLVTEQAKIDKEIKEAKSLLEQSKQIKRDAARASDLRQVLPHLREIFNGRNRLAVIEEQITAHNK